MIDAHCHLNASYTAESVGPIVNRFIELHGEKIIDVTTNSDDFAISQQIIAKYPTVVFSTVGFHPEGPDGSDPTFQQLETGFSKLADAVATAKNIVGIGETGLDYSFYENFPTNHPQVIDQQRELFVQHIALARTRELPLVIHARGKHVLDYSAYHDILTLLEQEKFPLAVYFHSFCGDYELAKKIVEQGNFIGINGIVTYSNAKTVFEVAEKIPAERMVLETDSPFLIPSNLDRKLLDNPKVNEPMSIPYIAKRIASLRRISEEEVLRNATATTKFLFAKMS